MANDRTPSILHVCPVWLLLTLFATTALADTTYYRWRDNNGQSHFGDAPPAEAVALTPLSLSAQEGYYRVEKVIDGDTIAIEQLGKVRLLGINTPEVAHRDRPAEPLGEAAKKRLTTLLSGKRITLQYDHDRRDRFGRLLAHISLEDGTNINQILLREGLARALFLPPNLLHLQSYYQAEAEARQARRGLWALDAYQIHSATSASECIKRFCRLRGKVLTVKRVGKFTNLQLPGGLMVTVHRDDIANFRDAGINLEQLAGQIITVRGWIGQRQSSPHLKLRHALQIESTPGSGK